MCYECLKHSQKQMENCPSCYFALLCSEMCKELHKKHRCVVRIRQSYIINKQNILNINNKTSLKNIIENKPYLLSTPIIFSEKSTLNSMVLV